jgi:hypothetical protein
MHSHNEVRFLLCCLAESNFMLQLFPLFFLFGNHVQLRERVEPTDSEPVGRTHPQLPALEVYFLVNDLPL